MSSPNVQLLVDALKHAASGSIGGSVAMCFVYPLDLIRTHQMIHRSNRPSMLATARQLTRHHGFAALYAGLPPVLVALTCSNAAYFFVYALLKALALRRLSAVPPALNSTLALLAGVFNVLLTSPLWVAATRIKLAAFANVAEAPSIWSQIRQIARTEGVPALWRGTLASLVLVCAPTVQFTVYDQAKEFLHAHHSSATFFLLGAVSKFVSTMSTYPLQLIQTRMRQSKLSLSETIMSLLREEGALALYKGIEAKLLQTMLMSAIHFLIYEWVAKVVMRLGAQQRALMINR
jgi:adenine nucleotide transporter 17